MVISRFTTWKARSALSTPTLPMSAAYDSYGPDCFHLTFRICLQEKPCKIRRCKSRSREVLRLSDHTKQQGSHFLLQTIPTQVPHTFTAEQKPQSHGFTTDHLEYQHYLLGDYVTSGSDWLSPLKSCWLCMCEDGARGELSCERNKMAFSDSSKENTRQKGSRDYIISRMSLLWLPKGVIFELKC